MFLLNLGYRWNVAPAIDNLDGVIVLASGSSSARLARSRPAEFQQILFDPQLYLAGLDANKCTKVCGRLASHGWFGVPDLPVFNSSTEVRSDWDQAVRDQVVKSWSGSTPNSDDDIHAAAMQCIEFQQRFSCSQIILPTPLIANREDEAQTTAIWLDECIGIAEELEVAQPLLATVAISDNVLNETVLSSGGLLETIVDQVTARENLDGVYIVVLKTRHSHPFETEESTLNTYTTLCNGFRISGYDNIIVNFCDIFGITCLGSGATGFATGPSHTLRQLSLDSYEDDTFGKALPHFYSHKVIGELRTEGDLDMIRDTRLLRRIRDVTIYSRPLMQELAKGGSAAHLAAWAESQNNLQAAQKHFIARVVAAERELRSLTLSEKKEEIRAWLEDASANKDYICRKLPEKIKGKLAPSDSWLELVDNIID